MVGTFVSAQFLTILYQKRWGLALFPNFNPTILHARVANNSLIIYERLGRYLKEFWFI